MGRKNMQQTNDLEPEIQRNSELHCHISDESKAWLLKKKKALNQPLGKIVDTIVRRVKGEK